MHDVSVVIVNYNMKERIDRCLASLFEDIKGESLSIDVVVVDNASDDGSLELLKNKYPEARLLPQSKNVGFGVAQNIGLASAQSQYYFVLNPDTYFYPGEKTIRKLYDFMEQEKKIGIVGPKILYPDRSIQYSCYRFPSFWHPFFIRTTITNKKGERYQRYFAMKEYDHQEKRPVDWLMGSALFIRGSALAEVGIFDESFWMYYEDSDLCRRFWEKGWGVYYFPMVSIEHVHSRGSAAIPGIFSAFLRNKLARVHVASWLRYMWKWRGNNKFYYGRKKTA
ncbi:MAG: glycosyltransferase family 2 protein [Patescibacteria group bacterium]